MRDLAIIVPSRGRPESVARLTRVCRDMSTTDYQLCWAFDDDDPTLDESKRAAAGGYIWTGPRDGLSGWTNKLWAELRGEFRYFASIGDDHIPRTPGWDAKLTGALEEHGGGFAYCWNGHHQDIPNFPEMCVVSAPVLDALGWFAHPGMNHYCIDVVWMDLGLAAGCLYYLPDVELYHDHWMFPEAAAPRDGTYWDAMESGGGVDPAALEAWRADGMAADVAKVKAALARGGESGNVGSGLENLPDGGGGLVRAAAELQPGSGSPGSAGGAAVADRPGRGEETGNG